MPATYEPIATFTLSSTNSVFSFTSIPQTYTDLRLVISFTPSSTSQFSITGNGATANWAITEFYGINNGTTTSRLVGQTAAVPAINIYPTSSTAGNSLIVEIPQYTATNRARYLYYRTTSMGPGVRAIDAGGGCNNGAVVAGAALTSLTITSNAGNTFDVGSTATLFGIKAA